MPTIEEDVNVMLRYHGAEPFQYIAGQAIAQLLVLPCNMTTPAQTEQLDSTDRGASAFGSTDVITPTRNMQYQRKRNKQDVSAPAQAKPWGHFPC